MGDWLTCRGLVDRLEDASGEGQPDKGNEDVDEVGLFHGQMFLVTMYLVAVAFWLTFRTAKSPCSMLPIACCHDGKLCAQGFPFETLQGVEPGAGQLLGLSHRMYICTNVH